MPIPSIAPYELPALPAEAPLPWLPSPQRAALLVHDMQEYFLRAFDREAEPLASVLARLGEIIAASRSAGIPVIYTAQPGDQHVDRRGLLAARWGAGLRSGEDVAIAAELAPAPGDIVMTKWRYSAFARTDLAEVLRHAGRDQLIITGVYTHLGCQVTAVDAFMNDVEPFLIADATADFSAAEHEQALRYVATSAGRVLNTDTLLDYLRLPSRREVVTATVPTERAERYVKQLASHMGRKATATPLAGGFSLSLPAARGIDAMGYFRATNEAVELAVTAGNAADRDKFADIIGRHLEKFGAKDGLTVNWVPAQGPWQA